MNLSDIIKLYDDNKALKVKNFFEELLNTRVEVRLRILDPRVNWYSIYIDLTKDMVLKLSETFEEIKINKNIFSNITTIDSPISMRMRIYNI